MLSKLFGDKRIIGLGADKSCLPKGTLIRTKDGLVKIEEANNILSYNFKKNIIEEKKANCWEVGKKKVFKIKTTEGIIKCSGEHRWFVWRGGKIILLPAKELNDSDCLLKI